MTVAVKRTAVKRRRIIGMTPVGKRQIHQRKMIKRMKSYQVSVVNKHQ